MNEDETRVSRTGEGQADEPGVEHRNGWAQEDQTAAASPNYERWHQNEPDTPPGGWNGSGSWPGRPPYASSGAPYLRPEPSAAGNPRERRSFAWVGVAIVVLAGLVAVGLVFFFTQGRDSGGSSNTDETVAASGSSQGAAPSSSSVTQSTDPLPPNGTTSCLIDASQTTNITDPNAVLTGTSMSCDFANRVISDVRSRVQSEPTIESFRMENEYSNAKNRSYNFTCNRSNHLTNCSTQGDHGTISLAVRDSVQ